MLTWDDVGSKYYESGLDRGVLYLPDGTAVPWNGLTSIQENLEQSTTATYFDGVKVNDVVQIGEFTATMKAITYPDEFITLEGNTEFRPGFFAGGQSPVQFGLCYRTKIGTDLEEDSGYKIHILYNVTAVPKNVSYSTLTNSPKPMEFEWAITTIPEDIPGARPTSHVTISSLTTDPWLFEELEAMLYGSSTSAAALLPMIDLINYISEWYRVKIVDNLDGTWTAISQRDGFIDFPYPNNYGYFTIANINAYYENSNVFIISDTMDIKDVPKIDIVDEQNGTWIAYSDNSSLIVLHENGSFEINEANVEFISPNEYRISNTPYS